MAGHDAHELVRAGEGPAIRVVHIPVLRTRPRPAAARPHEGVRNRGPTHDAEPGIFRFVFVSVVLILVFSYFRCVVTFLCHDVFFFFFFLRLFWCFFVPLGCICHL